MALGDQGQRHNEAGKHVGPHVTEPFGSHMD